MIQSLTRQAVLLDEPGGYQVAAAPAAAAIPTAAKAIHTTLCVGGAVLGNYQAKRFKGKQLKKEWGKTLTLMEVLYF